MASIATPLQSQAGNVQDPSLGLMDFNLEEPNEPVGSGRTPNPPFVFPRRGSDAYTDNVPPPLPAFSFNPGNLHAPSPSASAIPVPRPGGHRRRPSELIGGEGPPSPRMLSSSPGKPEPEAFGLPPPGPGAPVRGPGRRGHAHRRSQAMSSMDLTAMTKAFPPTLTVGSAPTTPADTTHEFPDRLSHPMSRSAVSLLHHPTPPGSPATQPEDVHPSLGNTLRPGQAPRPVSMISIETSSSLSTIRPGHSRVSSAAPTSKPENTSLKHTKVRPKTADAASLIMPKTMDHLPLPDLPSFRRSSLGTNLSESHNLSSEDQETAGTKSGKKKQTKKTKKKKHTLREDKHEKTGKSSLEAVDMARDLSSEKWESASSTFSKSGSEDAVSKSTRSSKKEKRVRSWAGAIFPLKSKRTHVRKISRRTPTPPPILTRTNSDMGSVDIDFDADATVIIRTPTNPNAPKQSASNMETAPPPDAIFENSWKPRSFYEQTITNDTFSPVIDLDAALGPFNTPEMSSGRIAGSAFSQATKRMYSGGRRGEFVGPEMRYHRRAESAPEMPPFDRSALGFPRLSSDATMAHADVFYEEEEDAFLAGNQPLVDEGQPPVDQFDDSGESVIEEEEETQPSSSETLQAVVRNTNNPTSVTPSDEGLGIQVTEKPAVVEDGPGDAIIDDSTTSHDELTEENRVDVFDFDQWVPPRIAPISSPDVSPLMLPMEKRPCSSPVDFAPSLPHLTFPSRQPSSSAFPSPDPSNMSFDGPRSATASSMTDQTTFNHPFSDQTQCSVEDVPSLASSVSTKTTSRGRLSSGFYTRPPGERPSSFSNHLPSRASNSTSAKRASLVSLSRLVGGSYGEKSKLCHEEKPPADDNDTRKKNHRISRLMFWKTKDKQKSRGDGD